MSSSMFDALEAAETLTRAGLTEPHARAIAATMRKAVSDGVATKSDVAELKAEIGAVRSEVGAVRSELKGDIGAVRAELKGDIGAVRAELWAVKWVLGFMFAIVLAMAARLFGVL